MTTTADKTQAPRTSVVSVAVTETEKNAVRAVAAARGLTDSTVMRDLTMDEVLEISERIRAAAGEARSA